jgi:hypothetical protein
MRTGFRQRVRKVKDFVQKIRNFWQRPQQNQALRLQNYTFLRTPPFFFGSTHSNRQAPAQRLLSPPFKHFLVIRCQNSCLLRFQIRIQIGFFGCGW